LYCWNRENKINSSTFSYTCKRARPIEKLVTKSLPKTNVGEWVIIGNTTVRRKHASLVSSLVVVFRPNGWLELK
jgi:hypothetical protein